MRSAGHDYDEGHRHYVEKLDPAAALWLRTKPFGAPPRDELARCLRTFAHAVETLDLELRAQVLDVGCGPGWLSEFLARCGYWVTGVDISEEMIEIARERVSAIREPVAVGIDAHAEFAAMPVRELPWENRFEAAILYDTLHHFDEELATLRAIQRALVPGGRIYIREGVRPAPGSPAERALVEEMKEYGTLEAWFDPSYLESVLRDAGFVDVRRFMEIDELFDLRSARPLLGKLVRHAATRFGLHPGGSNTFLASTPIAREERARPSYAASLELGSSGPTRERDDLVVPIRVANMGRAYWPAATGYPFPQGAVTLAPYTHAVDGERHELPRTLLPEPMPPGSAIDARARIPLTVLGNATELGVDLVREGIAWFSDAGSKPLAVSLSE